MTTNSTTWSVRLSHFCPGWSGTGCGSRRNVIAWALSTLGHGPAEPFSTRGGTVGTSVGTGVEPGDRLRRLKFAANLTPLDPSEIGPDTVRRLRALSITTNEEL